MDEELDILEDGVIGNVMAMQTLHEATPPPEDDGDDESDIDDAEALRKTQASVMDLLPSRQFSTAEVSLTRRKKSTKLRDRIRQSIDGRTSSRGELTIRSVEDLDWPGDDKIHPREKALKRQATLRRMSTKISDKRATLEQIKALQPDEEIMSGTISCWKAFRYRLSVGWKHFKDNFHEWKYHLSLWAGHLKQVESFFGTGIVSYFVFLRWVFLINVLLCCFWFCFVFIPHVAINFSKANSGAISQSDVDDCILNVGATCDTFPNTTSGGLLCLNDAAKDTIEARVEWYHYIVSIITGAPPLEDTALFMGAYENTELDVEGSNAYDLPLAYVIVGGLFFFTSLFLLVVKMSTAYRQNFVEGLSTGKKSPFFNMIFAAWDYSITDMEAAKMRHLSLKKDLEEVINTHRAQARHLTGTELFQLWSVRLLIHFAVLVLLSLAGVAIYFAAEVTLEAAVEQVDLSSFNFQLIMRQLAASLTISAFNAIYPFLFELLVPLENYRLPSTEFTWTIIRSVALRASGLVVLMATVLRQVECSSTVKACGRVIQSGNYSFNGSFEAFVETQTNCKLCWETYVGQEVYRLLIIDFLFEIGATLGVESVRHLLVLKVKFVREQLGKAEFIISKNVLGLVYAQALIWLGAFYSPLIPLVGIVLLFILFYVKKYSLMWNCQPAQRAYRASRTNIFFLFLLLIALFGCLIPVGYSMVEIQPSQTCGPFRSQARVYSVVTQEIDASPSWFQGIIDYIGSAAFVIPLIVFLCLIGFYFFALSKAYRKSIRILNHQLQLEGKDKQYLIKRVTEHEHRLLSARGQQSKGIAKVQHSHHDVDGLSSRHSATSSTQITVKPRDE